KWPQFVLGPAVALTLLGAAPTFSAQAPERPRVFLDTTYAAPGRQTSVPAGGDLQSALNSAQPGDAIVLQAGASYTGNFTLPVTSGSGWIYIQSSALSSLPAAGTRVGPGQASLMPKIVSPNTAPAISTAAGAHHFRFVGVEITTTWASARTSCSAARIRASRTSCRLISNSARTTSSSRSRGGRTARATPGSTGRSITSSS